MDEKQTEARDHELLGRLEARRVLIEIFCERALDDTSIRNTVAGEIRNFRDSYNDRPEGVLRNRTALRSFTDELDITLGEVEPVPTGQDASGGP